MRIAYFSPLPPEHSGIADYSRDLLPYLQQQADVTLFANEPEQVSPELQNQFPILPMRAYADRRWQFDVALYQMGNSVAHEEMFKLMCRYPGILVLHDYFLHHFMAHRTAGQGNPAGYSRELGFSLGIEGIELAWRLRMGLAPSPLFELPLNGRVLNTSLGVIAHSNYVQQLIQQERPFVKTAVIPEIMVRHAGQARRAELDWPADALIFASVGQITPAKQIEVALRAFKALQKQHPQCRYLLAGKAVDEVNIPQLIADLDLAGLVHHLGRVDDFQTFIDWIHTADVVLNLRYPTIGESSAAALRVMAAGRPLIVYDHGWYSEIPDEACMKVRVQDHVALVNKMAELKQSATLRQKMGEAAINYIEAVCQPTAVADAYIQFIQQTLQQLAAKYV